MHHILHDGLRKLKSIELRNANIIKYSSGGHYFFATEGSNIHIYNAYTFTSLKKIVVNTSKIFGLVFADLDKAFAAVGADGYLNRWKLPSFDEIGQSIIGNREPYAATKSGWSDFKAIDFVKEAKDASATEKHPW